MRLIYLPRERVKQKGIEALSDYELLALIFRTGTKERDVLEVAKTVLKEVAGVANIGVITLKKLCEIPGVGESKACSLLASIELGKRVYQQAQEKQRYQITSPDDCYAFFQSELKFTQQEVFIIILLNTKNQILSHREIYRGGLHHVEVHPREIFKVALEESAAGIILLHNHPSGDPTPSVADIQTTTSLIESGIIMGVPVLDHIIIGHASYVSLKALGKI